MQKEKEIFIKGSDKNNLYRIGFWLVSFLFFFSVVWLWFDDSNKQNINLPNNSATKSAEILPTGEIITEEKISSMSADQKADHAYLFRCTNDLDSYTLQYNKEIYTEYSNENNRCKYFSFSSFSFKNDTEVNVPIKIQIETADYHDIANEIAASLNEATSSNFLLKNNYQALKVSGSWPAESNMFGEQQETILVQKDAQHTLIFELNGNPTQNQMMIFEDLARTVNFL